MGFDLEDKLVWDDDDDDDINGLDRFFQVDLQNDERPHTATNAKAEKCRQYLSRSVVPSLQAIEDTVEDMTEMMNRLPFSDVVFEREPSHQGTFPIRVLYGSRKNSEDKVWIYFVKPLAQKGVKLGTSIQTRVSWKDFNVDSATPARPFANVKCRQQILALAFYFLVKRQSIVKDNDITLAGFEGDHGRKRLGYVETFFGKNSKHMKGAISSWFSAKERGQHDHINQTQNGHPELRASPGNSANPLSERSTSLSHGPGETSAKHSRAVSPAEQPNSRTDEHDQKKLWLEDYVNLQLSEERIQTQIQALRDKKGRLDSQMLNLQQEMEAVNKKQERLKQDTNQVKERKRRVQSSMPTEILLDVVFQAGLEVANKRRKT